MDDETTTPLPAEQAPGTETLRVGLDTWVTVTFTGPIDQAAVQRLIRHYEAMLDLYPTTEGGDVALPAEEDASAGERPKRRRGR